MWIVIGVVVLVLILLVVSANAGQKQQMEQARLELTAEHQRLQRENPEHADAQKGLEEFILSRFNEAHGNLRDRWQQMRKALLRFGFIGAVVTLAAWHLLGLGVGDPGFDIALPFIIGFIFCGAIGGVFTRIKQGRVRLRIQTE